MLTQLGLTPKEAAIWKRRKPRLVHLISKIVTLFQSIRLPQQTIVGLLSPLSEPETLERIKKYTLFLQKFLSKDALMALVHSEDGEQKFLFVLSKIDELRRSGLNSQHIQAILSSPMGLENLSAHLFHQQEITDCLQTGYTLDEIVQISAQFLGALRLECFLQQRSFLESDRYGLRPRHVASVYAAPIAPMSLAKQNVLHLMLQKIVQFGRVEAEEDLIDRVILNHDLYHLTQFHQFIADLIRVHNYGFSLVHILRAIQWSARHFRCLIDLLPPQESSLFRLESPSYDEPLFPELGIDIGGQFMMKGVDYESKSSDMDKHSIINMFLQHGFRRQDILNVLEHAQGPSHFEALSAFLLKNLPAVQLFGLKDILKKSSLIRDELIKLAGREDAQFGYTGLEKLLDQYQEYSPVALELHVHLYLLKFNNPQPLMMELDEPRRYSPPQTPTLATQQDSSPIFFPSYRRKRICIQDGESTQASAPKFLGSSLQ